MDQLKYRGANKVWFFAGKLKNELTERDAVRNCVFQPIVDGISS